MASHDASLEGETRGETRDRSRAEHFGLAIARTVASFSTCSRRQVGAVVLDHETKLVIATGYNGTPRRFLACNAGGCERCATHPPDGVPSLASYDTCLCVHAEANALYSAARLAHSVLGACLYTTVQPCLPCALAAYQSGIARIIYAERLAFPPTAERAYTAFQNQAAPAGFRIVQSPAF